jgi:hypothetical protein
MLAELFPEGPPQRVPKGPIEKHVGPYLSTFDLADELGVSAERIRMLVVKLFTPTDKRPELGKIVFKDERGYWQIPRSWADKYQRLRAAYQAQKLHERELTQMYGKAAGHDNPLDKYLTAADAIVLVNGKPASLPISIGWVLGETFGPFPILLDVEAETVLRAIEVLNSPRRITHRTCWTDNLANWIEQEGPLRIEWP